MKRFTSEVILLITAAIWGFAFVAQRQGNQCLSPLIFNGLRFGIGSLAIGLIRPIIFRADFKNGFPFLIGVVLFIAASLQQIGLIWTTAGNAGFITGLYIVFIPILGFFRKQKLTVYNLLSILLACIGMFLLSIKEKFSFNNGDLIVLCGAVFWAWHVQLVDKYTKKLDTMYLAFCQAAICSLLSLTFGFIFLLLHSPLLGNSISTEYIFLHLIKGISKALLPLLYSGFLSVGVAYTLQVSAQKNTPPLSAAIILCSESVFALIGGWWLLNEHITFRMISGACLLLMAMLFSIYSKYHKSIDA